MEHIKDVEDFFSAFQGSAADSLEYDSLLEVFQGVMTGFVVELCELDDGARYSLMIGAHSVRDWNITDDAFSACIVSAGDDRTTYVFKTLGEAQEALATFLRVAL